MKNIKLKAFNEGDKKLVDVINISFFDDEILVGYKVYSGEQRSLKNPIIVQSTGLLDKNGKEIYEGDILKTIDEVVKIYLNTAMACFDIEFVGGDTESLVPAMGEWDEIRNEVIGNIYENPELNEDFEY